MDNFNRVETNSADEVAGREGRAEGIATKVLGKIGAGRNITNKLPKLSQGKNY